MKVTLTILITGFILLTTPLLATAHGSYHDRQYDTCRSEVRYDSACSVNTYHGKSPQRFWRGEKRQLRRELRETRRELRCVNRRLNHQRQRPYYVARPYYVKPPVVFGFPQLIFQFGW